MFRVEIFEKFKSFWKNFLIPPSGKIFWKISKKFFSRNLPGFSTIRVKSSTGSLLASRTWVRKCCLQVENPRCYFSHLLILTFEGEVNGICRSDVCSSCRARWALLISLWKCSSTMFTSKVIVEERSGPSQNVWKKWKSYVPGRD